MILKDESRMQAYGWSLPSKSKSKSNDSQSSNSGTKNNLAFSVPVPVYCRPLFENDSNLKLSSSSTINFSYDKDLLKDCGQLIESSPFSYFKSKSTSYSSFADENTKYKTSCIWICNLMENDTHISILDANKPSEIISQFNLKSIKIYCIQSITGVLKKSEQLNEKSFNSYFETQKQRIISKEININKEFENISFVEFKALENTNNSSLLQPDVSSSSSTTSNEEGQTKTLSTMYPTMWLGSQEGLLVYFYFVIFYLSILIDHFIKSLLIHSSISNVSKTLERIKLNDAILCIM